MGIKLGLVEALELFPEMKPNTQWLLHSVEKELERVQYKSRRAKRIQNKHFNRLWMQKKYHEAMGIEALGDNLAVHKVQKNLQWFVYEIQGTLNKRDYVTNTEKQRALEVPLHTLLPKGLKKRGHQYTCPFHKEKTASFNIFKDNGYFCFGCRAHGDTIRFVMEYYKLDYKRAVRAINSYQI